MPADAAPRALLLPMRRALLAGYVAALVALPVAVGLGWLLAGAAGGWGALLGLGLPVAFLSVTGLVALGTARLEATPLGVVVLGSWLVKLALLVAVLAALRGADFYSRGVFFAVFLVATAGYLVLEAWTATRTRTPYVEPRRSTGQPRRPGGPTETSRAPRDL